MNGFLAQHGAEIAELTLEHLWLTGSAMLLAAAIGVPTGIWLTRHPRWAKPVLGVVNIIQTIPSLALFGFLLPLSWIGHRAHNLRRHRRGGSHGVGCGQGAGHDQWPEAAQSGASPGRRVYPGRLTYRNRTGCGHCHHR